MYFSSDDLGVYRVFHRHDGQESGIIGVGMPNYDAITKNMTIAKRYPSFDYLCEGYMGVSYCADVNNIARVIDDDHEIEYSVSEMYDEAIDGSWTSKFFKLYTYNSDGYDESWQLSLRTFYIEPNTCPYETECDTGH